MADLELPLIHLTPEMVEIMDRMRGHMPRERFLLTLLKMVDSGAVSSSQGGSTAPPIMTSEKEIEGYKNRQEVAEEIEKRSHSGQD